MPSDRPACPVPDDWSAVPEGSRPPSGAGTAGHGPLPLQARPFRLPGRLGTEKACKHDCRPALLCLTACRRIRSAPPQERQQEQRQVHFMDTDHAKRREAYRKELKSLRLFDDNFMTLFFRDNIEGAQLLVRTILDRPDLSINATWFDVHHPLAMKAAWELVQHRRSDQGCHTLWARRCSKLTFPAASDRTPM